MADEATQGNGTTEGSGEAWSAYSTAGLGRLLNADAWAIRVFGGRVSVAVADGVGRKPGSYRASAAAVAAAAECGARLDGANSVPERDVLAAVNQAVAEALGAAGVRGATTLAGGILSKHGGLLMTVGDSEVLAVAASGPAECLNELDHVPSRPMLLLAWIDGVATVEPHLIQLSSAPYRICFVTDGVTSVLDYAELGEIVRANPVSGGARAVVDAARAAGALDDVTAVVVAPDLLNA